MGWIHAEYSATFREEAWMVMLCCRVRLRGAWRDLARLLVRALADLERRELAVEATKKGSKRLSEG